MCFVSKALVAFGILWMLWFFKSCSIVAKTCWFCYSWNEFCQRGYLFEYDHSLVRLQFSVLFLVVYSIACKIMVSWHMRMIFVSCFSTSWWKQVCLFICCWRLKWKVMSMAKNNIGGCFVTDDDDNYSFNILVAVKNHLNCFSLFSLLVFSSNQE